MPNLILTQTTSVQEKISLMQESSRFDVADCDDFARGDYCGSSIKAPHVPPKVPKVFLSSDCIFDCAYCGCRKSNERAVRYTHKPEEMAEISVKIARSNRAGIFITSAVCKNPDYTEELILQTLKIIRFYHRYKGYVHAKIMPGADPLLIRKVGLLADRISVNIELPKSEGYQIIAKQKNKKNIITPMQTIRALTAEYNANRSRYAPAFARAGQTTQMMVGTMQESDKTIITLAEALYKKFNMRRVYYSPFNPVQTCDSLPAVGTPRWRSRRIYQADRLMQLYGMTADELLPEPDQNLDFDIDPKASWALRNIGLFPVEVNTADYEMLIRVPGIGVTSAQKILRARREAGITHEMLMKMGVPLRHSVYFITAGGKYYGGNMLDSPNLRGRLCGDGFAVAGGVEQIGLRD